jgi:PIN domain nuclease of toxin-antitoxin system
LRARTSAFGRQGTLTSMSCQPACETARDFFDDLSNPSFHPLPVATAHVVDVDELRFTHDPFDGLICAAARDLDLPLVTPDMDITASGAVRVIW